MHPLVRDLCKRIILVSKIYPGGAEYVLNRYRQALVKNREVVDDLKLKTLIRQGRYWVRELEMVAKIHKFRAMKSKYEVDGKL